MLPSHPTLLDLLATLLILGALAYLSVVDLRERRLPDAVTLPVLITGLALAAWRDGHIPYAAMLGAGVGYSVFALIGEVYFRARGTEGLGLGDAKLMGALGAWLGWEALPAAVLGASLMALVAAFAAGRRSRENIAFGPFIALAFAGLWLAFVGADAVRLITGSG
ncbi:MAG: A24 family peptidase [Pseudomonadota bacterium]